MRARDNVSGSVLPIFRDLMTSKSSTGTDSTAETEKAGVYHDLDYAGVRFRRVRDDMLDNLRTNFRRFEDVFNGWNKECMQMSSSFLYQKVPKGTSENWPALGKKIKETLEGLQEVEELGKQLNIKFGVALKKITTKSGSKF